MRYPPLSSDRYERLIDILQDRYLGTLPANLLAKQSQSPTGARFI